MGWPIVGRAEELRKVVALVNDTTQGARAIVLGGRPGRPHMDDDRNL